MKVKIACGLLFLVLVSGTGLIADYSCRARVVSYLVTDISDKLALVDSYLTTVNIAPQPYTKEYSIFVGRTERLFIVDSEVRTLTKVVGSMLMDLSAETYDIYGSLPLVLSSKPSEVGITALKERVGLLNREFKAISLLHPWKQVSSLKRLSKKIREIRASK